MGLTLVTAPAAEPLTTAEAKTHLRVDNSEDDVYIGALITAARQEVERYTGRALVTQTWDLTLDAFPWGNGPIWLPRPPVQSVTSISYVDDAGATQTWATANYRVDITGETARIEPAWSLNYPTTRGIVAAVTVRFVAGYGAAAAVPALMVHAIKLLVGEWYEQRQITTYGAPGRAPWAVAEILSRYRVLDERVAV